MAQRTGDFIMAMGGTQADLIIVEWSDRDAGSGIRPWWDDSDSILPRPNRAILWENALSNQTDKRLLLWQVPCGNMSLSNEPGYYRDNRSAYAFQHTAELQQAGVSGLLFGPGDGNQAAASRDNGYIQAQGAVFYAIPSTPAGLNLVSVDGPVATVTWNSGPEPDIQGYRLMYRTLPAGKVYYLDARRKTSERILLATGDWSIRAQSYDLLGQLSPLSNELKIHIIENPQHHFLAQITR